MRLSIFRNTLLLLALPAMVMLGPVPAWATSALVPTADPAEGILLWPGGLAPGDKPLPEAQQVIERSTDPALPDRYVTHVSEPRLMVYRPPHPNGSALLVVPGGGYQRVVLDKEGTALVPVLADQGGVTLFVLRYRLPGEGREDREAALADAQRAMRLIRHQAGQWGLDRRRIGVIGFSAGGHVAARLGAGFDAPVYPATDAIDGESARPDFQLLVYPVIDMDGADAHPGSRERLLGTDASVELQQRHSMQTRVRPDMPPTFLVHAADDDVVPVNNSLMMFQALQRAGVPAELHVFPHGGHGFGIRGTAHLTTAAWPRLALDWIASLPMENTP